MTELHQNQLDEPIEIQPYDPVWIEVFRSESANLWARLRDQVIAIEHIGSTAIPGLRSKPVIDVMVGVEAIDLFPEVLAPLLDEYDSLGEAGVPGRLYFRKRKNEAINVHAVEYLGRHWVNNILVREYLLAHPHEAERYGRAKDRILAEGLRTLLAYSHAKQTIMAKLLTDARAWGHRHSLERGNSA